MRDENKPAWTSGLFWLAIVVMIVSVALAVAMFWLSFHRWSAW